MSLPSINFLHLTVSEIQPGQTFSRQDAHPPAPHPDTMGENNTPTALKGCGVKIVSRYLRHLLKRVLILQKNMNILNDCLLSRLKKVFGETLSRKNSIRDAHTPKPGEIVFNTMRNRSSETVQRLGYFHSSVSYIKVQIMFK